MTLPNPYAQEQLPIFEIDVAAFFAACADRIAFSRTRRQQPSITPEGKILIGAEQVPRMDEYKPPMIVIVPVGGHHEAARHQGDLVEPKFLASHWIDCEAHCWGYDDPEQRSTTFAFSSALELWRQLYDAMTHVPSSVWGGSGQPNIDDVSGEWKQRQDINRNGRMYVVSFSLWTPLVADPPIAVPMQTASNPGATVSVTANLTSADGSEVQQEAEFNTP